MTEFRPTCMTDTEWADWNAANDAILWRKAKAEWPCIDCIPAWARERRAEGLCNGIPGFCRKPSIDPKKAAQRAKWREQSRRWRAAHPEESAAISRRYRERMAAATEAAA